MTRILRDVEVTQIIDRRATVELMESGYRADANGEVVTFPRSRIDAGEVTVAWMGAALPNLDLLGFRSYLYNSAGIDRGEQVVALYRFSAMELKALFLGQLVGSLRTGASVVAALKIADSGLRTLGLIGTGNQARHVLACASAVFPLDSIWAWSPNANHCAEFRDWAKAELDQTVHLGENARQVLKETSAVAVLTSSEQPVVTSDMISGPKLLVSISAYRHPEVELPLLDAARRIWTDSVDQASNRGTLFQDPLRRDRLRPLLHQGDFEALRDHESTRIVINTGAAWEEVLLAESLLGSAERSGLGTAVPPA